MSPVYAVITLISTIWLMITPNKTESITGKTSSFSGELGIL